jgi:hypothetical protein
MASKISAAWTNLNMPGSCPISTGDKFVDPGILPDGAAEVRADFTSTSASCYSTLPIESVTIAFVDGREETVTGNKGHAITVAGTGANQGKTIDGIWLKAGDVGPASQGKGQYIAMGGATMNECTLDFFFAERHTTQSNFRIDTSMNLVAQPPTTISPLYD